MIAGTAIGVGLSALFGGFGGRHHRGPIPFIGGNIGGFYPQQNIGGYYPPPYQTAYDYSSYVPQPTYVAQPTYVYPPTYAYPPRRRHT